MRTYGEWLSDKLHELQINKKEFVIRLGGAISYSFIADLCRDRETPNGTVKIPSRENAIAIGEALNTDPAKLADDINKSLVMAGYRPQTPATILFDEYGDPIVAPVDNKLFHGNTDAASIHQRLDQQQLAIEQLLELVRELSRCNIS